MQASVSRLASVVDMVQVLVLTMTQASVSMQASAVGLAQASVQAMVQAVRLRTMGHLQEPTPVRVA